MQLNKNSFCYILPFIILILLLSFCWRNVQSSPATVLPELTGKRVPPFNLPSVLYPGKRFTDKNLRGRIVILNIWASWCSACLAEHSTLMKIKEQYHIPIYGINFKDNIHDARASLKKNGNPYLDVGMDTNGDIATDFGIDGTPETFLIDPHGMIRYRHDGTLDDYTWEYVLLPLIKS